MSKVDEHPLDTFKDDVEKHFSDIQAEHRAEMLELRLQLMGLRETLEDMREQKNWR